MGDSAGVIALLLAYSGVIMIASLVGGWAPSLMRLTHTRMQVAMSFVAGLMLGVGLLHLLPHAAAQLEKPSIDFLAAWMLTGLLTMFLLIRALDFHHHDAPLETVVSEPGPPQPHHHLPVAHLPVLDVQRPIASRLSWVGAALGMVLHSMIDGVALAASVAAEAGAHEGIGWFGLGTFFAVLFHKPLDAFPITTLMARSGWSARARGWVNILFALTCPAGVLAFYFGWEWLGGDRPIVLAGALAFSAGVFLCISLGDLLPEVHFHHHDRAKLTAALLVGIALAYGIGFLEGEHAHQHHHDHQEGSVDHAHPHE